MGLQFFDQLALLVTKSGDPVSAVGEKMKCVITVCGNPNVGLSSWGKVPIDQLLQPVKRPGRFEECMYRAAGIGKQAGRAL